MADSSIAMLGTGAMGAAMARRLSAAGFDVRVWNRTRDRAEPLGGDGATAVDETRQESGALGGMPDDAIWLQVATVGALAAAELAALAEAPRIGFVDAPVAGTKEPAEQDELAVPAPGSRDLRDRGAPVFDAVGKETRWVSRAGRAGSAAPLASVPERAGV